MRVARQLAAGLLLAGAASALPQETFAPVQELLAGHQLAAALERAEEFEDELLAEQSRVYVLHESGDLVGALAEGLRALERTPDDPFLLEECGGVAAALGQVEILRTLAPRLEAQRADRMLPSPGTRGLPGPFGPQPAPRRTL